VAPGDMARIAQPIDWLGLNTIADLCRADRARWVLPGPMRRLMALTGVGWRIDPEAFRNEVIARTALQASGLHYENGTEPRDAG